MKNLFFSLSIIGLFAAIVYQAYIPRDYTWSQKITVKVPKDQNEEKRFYELFENSNFMDYHPFCTSHKLLEEKSSNEKIFEFIEETTLFGLIPIKLVSKAHITKLPQEGNIKIYRTDVPLKILNLIETSFNTEFIISEHKENYQIEERVTIKGNTLISHIVGIIAYPEHVELMSKIAKDFN
jgi:hypothetical protein